MSVLSDSVGKRVLDIEDNVEQCLMSLLSNTLSEERLQKMRAVCMDMWESFALTVKKMPVLNWCIIRFFSVVPKLSKNFLNLFLV